MAVSGPAPTRAATGCTVAGPWIGILVAVDGEEMVHRPVPGGVPLHVEANVNPFFSEEPVTEAGSRPVGIQDRLDRATALEGVHARYARGDERRVAIVLHTLPGVGLEVVAVDG